MTMIFSRTALIAVFLFAGIGQLSAARPRNKISEYGKQLLSNLENELKCRHGFRGISPKLVAAVESCSNHHKEISSPLCFALCTYRTLEYIVPGKDNETDQAMADWVAMDMIDMRSKKGRDSYFDIVITRFTYAEEYVKNLTFGFNFDGGCGGQEVEDFFKHTFTGKCSKDTGIPGEIKN